MVTIKLTLREARILFAFVSRLNEKEQLREENFETQEEKAQSKAVLKFCNIMIWKLARQLLKLKSMKTLVQKELEKQNYEHE